MRVYCVFHPFFYPFLDILQIIFHIPGLVGTVVNAEFFERFDCFGHGQIFDFGST